jgi:tRNA(Arg) A34 adenosine deaminase TadA
MAVGGLAGSLATGVAFSVIDWHPSVREGTNVFPNLDHPRYMRLAIEQARKVPDLPFGAVIVDGTSGEVVARGYNRSKECPTFHGEIDAINRCAAEHPGIDWSKLALYTTAEPCPMCQGAIEWAGIALTVYGTSIPFLVSLGWWQTDIRADEVIRRTPFRKTAIIGGVLEAECNALFQAVPKGLYREKK